MTDNTANGAAAGTELSPDLVADVDRGEINHQQLGDRIGAVLQHANDWARRMVAEAEAEAIRTRERAKAEARKMTADAEAEAEHLRNEAEAEADRRIKYAEARLEELRESAEVARQRTKALKRRLAAVVERLEEEDYNLELPAGIEIPELTEELDESEEPELQLDSEAQDEVRLEDEEVEEAQVVDSQEIKTGGTEIGKGSGNR